jgi:hypothetical protein
LTNVEFVVTLASILTLSKLGEPFEVINDASVMRVGVIPLQDGRPTTFESRKFSFVERSSTTKEQELALVVHAMQTQCCYLGGLGCTVMTNHNSFVY